MVAGLLVLVGAILIGMYAFGGDGGGDSKVPVPSFVGQPEKTARKMAANVDLKVSITKKACANQATGNVCSQDPQPDEKVEKNSTVNLVVSTGAPKVTVPDVRGIQFDQAEAQLKEKGFQVEKKTQVSTQTPDVVITQDPEGGTSKEKGTTITLTVAKAEEKITVPDVTGKSCDEAKAELQAKGLAPTCNDTPVTDPAQDGKVQNTNPPAGQQVSKNTPVAINVGKAQQPQQKPVPDVQGKPLKEAQQILQQQGFTQIQVNGPSDDKARVVLQTPPQGTQGDPGSTQIVLTTADFGGGNNGGDNGGGGFIGG